jgi:hypothetical protein
MRPQICRVRMSIDHGQREADEAVNLSGDKIYAVRFINVHLGIS